MKGILAAVLAIEMVMVFMVTQVQVMTVVMALKMGVQ